MKRVSHKVAKLLKKLAIHKKLKKTNVPTPSIAAIEHLANNDLIK